MRLGSWINVKLLAAILIVLTLLFMAATFEDSNREIRECHGPDCSKWVSSGLDQVAGLQALTQAPAPNAQGRNIKSSSNSAQSAKNSYSKTSEQNTPEKNIETSAHHSENANMMKLPKPSAERHSEEAITTSSYPPPPPLPPTFQQLTNQQIAGVERFVFFIGYGRSGHSIVASIMDAHPNIIIAHEYYLFDRLANPDPYKSLWKKKNLFNSLYYSSYNSVAHGWRADHNTSKGYNLNLNGTWQGQFDKLKVIGDKTAGATAMMYHRAPRTFKNILTLLERTTHVPYSALHVVRNPYDMVATVALYQASGNPDKTKVNASVTNKFNNETYLTRAANIVLTKAAAVMEMVEDCHLHVLEVHLEDFIADPDDIIQRLCHFLHVPCDPAYLEVCRGKVFQNPSRSRDLVVWPDSVRRSIETAISDFSFFNRYSFYS